MKIALLSMEMILAAWFARTFLQNRRVSDGVISASHRQELKKLAEKKALSMIEFVDIVDINHFFTEKIGVEVDNVFVRDVLAKIFRKQVSENFVNMEVVYVNLLQKASDKTLRAISFAHIFEGYEGLLALAWILLMQWRGETGLLLTDGRANIFYLRLDDGSVISIGVRRSEDGKWYINAWKNPDVWSFPGERIIGKV